jgi:hypothetical protein
MPHLAIALDVQTHETGSCWAFQKELYDFESLCKRIQRTYIVFGTGIK